MEVVYLPDLDEQYVIRSKNLLAKSAVGLAFRNGSELVEVQGEHDSTTVTLSLLTQLQTAISTAKDVEVARINRQADVLKAQQPTTGGTARGLIWATPSSNPSGSSSSGRGSGRRCTA